MKHSSLVNKLVKRFVKTTKKKVSHHNKKLTSIKLGKKFANRYMLYYGAKQRLSNECNTNLDVNRAYNNNNRGVSKLNSKGEAKIYMKCPKSYKNNMSHIHFLLSDKSNKKWLSKQYEHKVICDVDKQFVKNAIKNRCYILINALSVDSYIQNRIPTSISIPYNTAATDLSIKNYLLQVSKKYPKLVKFSNSKGKDIFNVPIIVYCYNSGCNAGEKLIER